jgi:hypothetical protein
MVSVNLRHVAALHILSNRTGYLLRQKTSEFSVDQNQETQTANQAQCWVRMRKHIHKPDPRSPLARQVPPPVTFSVCFHRTWPKADDT